MQAGDKVKIRQWDDMEKEFGADRFGNIRCEAVFVSDMLGFCGGTYTIKRIISKDWFCLEGDSEGWNFSLDMIEK